MKVVYLKGIATNELRAKVSLPLQQQNENTSYPVDSLELLPGLCYTIAGKNKATLSVPPQGRRGRRGRGRVVVLKVGAWLKL